MPAGELIVIPARWGSTRFPGKPLADIGGRSMLRRAIDIAEAVARQRPGLSLVVATDDDRIADHVRGSGHEAVLTDPSLASGTDRALAAATARSSLPSVVVNLQGDTPFTAPATIVALFDAIAAGAPVATPVVRLDWPALDRLREQKLASPFSGTTCTRRDDGEAIWFSKQIIPALRGEDRLRAASPLSPVFRHIGLYAYRLEALTAFAALPVSAYERLEGLEQLRFLDAGVPIQTVEVAAHRHMMTGIDTPADLDRARRLIAEHGEPAW